MSMSVDWTGELASWGVTAETEPPEDWLAAVIRRALRSLVGNAAPPPAAWVRIRHNIEAMAPSLLHQEEDPSC